jgi:ferredoxin
MFLRLLRRFSSQSCIKFYWVNPDGTSKLVEGETGETLLVNAHKNGIDLEGACDGSAACSTCHVILPEDLYDKQPPATADEEDMLDLAFGLTPTSRLGCQLKLSNSFENSKIQLPSASVNMYVDGHKPKPH